MAYLTWDSALVYDPTGSTDIPDLLEFANAQYLELRYYDNFLNHAIDTTYDVIGEPDAMQSRTSASSAPSGTNSWKPWPTSAASPATSPTPCV